MKISIIFFSCLIMPLFSFSLQQKAVLDSKTAETLIAGCVQYQQKEKIPPMGIAIVDDGGHLIAFLRQDGAIKTAILIPINKAISAALSGRPSRFYKDIAFSKNGHLGVSPGLAFQPNVTTLAGALPIIVNGKTIGAIGVGGGSEDQDENCAKAGLAFAAQDLTVTGLNTKK